MMMVLMIMLFLGSPQFLLHGPPWKYSSKNSYQVVTMAVEELVPGCYDGRPPERV
jgi:hypothetical protein